MTVDVGAEAMLNRRPEGADLARELGLTVVHPAATPSRLWTRGALRPLPRSLMGVPLDLDELAASGVLSAAGLRPGPRRAGPAATELDDADVSVGELVADRLGEEVVDRLVEPLLGGVYAGHARELSARATTPQLVALLDRGSLLEAAAAAVPTSDAPVFAGLPGGLGALPGGAGRLRAVRGPHRRHGARSCARSRTGFELAVGSRPRRGAGRGRRASCWPSRPRRPPGCSPTWRRRRPRELAAIEYASMAVVTLAFRAAEVPAIAGRRRSGFLVPPVEGRRIKAATFSFAKWDWVRAAAGALDGEDVLLLRTSLGRHREEATLQAHRRGAGRRLARRPRRRHRARRAPRSTATCSAGAAACRSTPSATSTGSPGSGPTSPGCRAWRSAARRTTGWASRR